MSEFEEYQRRRFLRPDAHRYIRHDAWRYMAAGSPVYVGEDVVKYLWPHGEAKASADHFAEGMIRSDFNQHLLLQRRELARLRSDWVLLTTTRECTITDISDSGARLFVSGDVPDFFFLDIGGDTNTRHECRVAWRLGGEIGVEFVAGKAEQSRLDVIERIRQEARQAFQSSSRAS